MHFVHRAMNLKLRMINFVLRSMNFVCRAMNSECRAMNFELRALNTELCEVNFELRAMNFELLGVYLEWRWVYFSLFLIKMGEGRVFWMIRQLKQTAMKEFPVFIRCRWLQPTENENKQLALAKMYLAVCACIRIH